MNPPPKHDPKIPRDLAKYVRPVFIRLSNRDLLERCTLVAMQNQNESFNKTVWSKASKNQFLSKPTVKFAVDLSVITFNENGLSVLGREIGIEPSLRLMNFFKDAYRIRLNKSDRKADEVVKRRRKDKARARAEEDESNIEREGTTYAAGQF